MTEPEKRALAIYEMICVDSGDCPIDGSGESPLLSDSPGWEADHPALVLLRDAGADVQLAFLEHSCKWLRAEARAEHYRVCLTMSEAIKVAIDAAPKPLPAELMLGLLTELRQDFNRWFYPFAALLATLTSAQVTPEIRAELRKLYPQFAPSPTGKIDRITEQTRERIAELMREAGERQLDPGRGPWSQAVFDEINGKEEIASSGWIALLEHCRALKQAVPGAKWNRRACELMKALGETEAAAILRRWLQLGPTPGQPAEARPPIEDSGYQKGVVWYLGLSRHCGDATAIGAFGLACLRKIPNLGAVSQKVGFACIQALGEMECPEAVAALSRLRVKVKYAVARRLIERSLQQAAERAGLTMEALEDLSVESYGLDAQCVAVITVGSAVAALRLRQDGKVALTWQNADGKPVKSAPADVKTEFAKEVKAVAARARELDQACCAQRARMEASLTTARTMSLDHWRKCFAEHPLLGFLGRRLIWVFSNPHGWERAGLWFDGCVRDSALEPLDLTPATEVRLWHPLSSAASEVQCWRERIFSAAVRQPFRQAFREFYHVTDTERETRMYSNRFAGVLMRQHQFASLCRERGWNYRLMSTNFDSNNIPSKQLDHWNMNVEFYVDLPLDRKTALRGSALDEKSAAAINLFVGSDQVRFYRDHREIAVDEVPAIVYSEVMRDVDLFTSVCSVGDDETWSDQGDRGDGIFQRQFGAGETTALIALRTEIVSRVLPHTPIAARCSIRPHWLEVRGHLGTYRIYWGWGGVMLAADSGPRWLKIPKKLLDAVPLDPSELPLDLDYRSEMILRKARILADDWKIDSPDLVRQLMPE